MHSLPSYIKNNLESLKNYRKDVPGAERAFRFSATSAQNIFCSDKYWLSDARYIPNARGNSNTVLIIVSRV